MKAYSLIRKQPWYRHDAFLQGLGAAGYEVRDGYPHWPISPGDVLCIWNRYGDVEAQADRFEREGGTVIVAENGYLGAGGSNPKFQVAEAVRDDSYYALAIHGHNGSGTTPEPRRERFERLGVALKPWRESGDHILICPNRNFGMRGFVMPADWADQTAKEIRNLTDRPIRIRAHPGNKEPSRSLEEDLQTAWACVIWSSSAGIHALVGGIPVVSMAPYWICKRAAGSIDNLRLDDADRLAAFEHMASAQWTVTEIKSGEAFRQLLSHSRQAQSAAAV